ncbi:hypothetical protein [Chitinophaga sp. RAB17]|uniref:tetratricopeptide repeat protein n=1 Tax=Chitinophaga sp. RAB17 TaxID=3233049 RepID=UPI003F92F500
MNETLHYIDDYFSGALSAAEKQTFEQRCVADPDFAKEIAFYLSARDSLQQQLYEQKKQLFTERHAQTANVAATAEKTRGKLFYYITAAAACLLILLGWFFIFKAPSPQQLAGQYIQTDLQQLSVTMHSGSDSLQSGIAAYNNKDYDRAEKIFQSLTQQEAIAPDATRYLGLVYLISNKYDKAVATFDTLIKYPLYANPGPFYKALALMRRNSPGDRQQAKLLLEEVRDRKLPGNKQAIQWLKKM